MRRLGSSSSRCSSPASSRRWERSRPGGGPAVPKVVIIVGPAGAATDGYRAEARAAAAVARSYTPGRHRGLLAQRDVAGRQERAPGRSRSSSTWATATAGRAAIATRSTRRPRTASGSTRAPAATTTPTSTSARTGSRPRSSSPRTRSSCSTTSATRAGNTEPGLPEGTLDQAKQRVDNYAAGFIDAGAAAVIAEA